MDTEKQRRRRRDDVRLTESGNARSEQLNARGAYRVADREQKRQKRAAKYSCLQSHYPTEFGLPEWIRTSKARLVFRYEISDL